MQQLLLLGLEVRQQADLFQHLELQILGLIDDHDDIPAALDALEQHAVDLGDEVGLATGDLIFAELLEDGPQHLSLGDPRVEDQRRVETLRVELVEEPPAEDSLTAADLAHENDEALALSHAEFEVLERLLVGGAEIEKLGIGGDVERHLPESVEALVHFEGEAATVAAGSAKRTNKDGGGGGQFSFTRLPRAWFKSLA